MIVEEKKKSDPELIKSSEYPPCNEDPSLSGGLGSFQSKLGERGHRKTGGMTLARSPRPNSLSRPSRENWRGRGLSLEGAEMYHMTTPVGFTDTTKLLESLSVTLFPEKTS